MVRHGLLLVGLQLLPPNLLGSVFNIIYNDNCIYPLISKHQHQIFIQTTIAYNLLVYPVLFWFWLRMLFRMRPAYTAILQDRTPTAEHLVEARRTVINLPWIAAAVSAAGWLGCIPTFTATLYFADEPLQLWVPMSLGISFLISAQTAVTLGMFLIEIICQSILFPVLFRDAEPINIPGTVPLRLRTRGFLWAFAAGIGPIVSLLLLDLVPRETDRSILGLKILVGITAIVFGLAIAWLVGTATVIPVLALSRAAQAVAGGDRRTRIDLLRANEFGQLIHDFNTMVGELREKDEITQTFGRHIGQAVAQLILSRHPTLGGWEENVAVLFVDIRNFTARCSHSAPADIVQQLNLFFSEMVDVVEEAHQGVVNKFLGDGFMALFGPFTGQHDYADAAVRTGQEILRRLDGVNRLFAERGFPPVAVGIGIHAGPAIVGCVGSAARMEFTAIGDTINLASRVEGLTKTVGHALLITDAALDLMRHRPRTEQLPSQTVKGKDQPVVVYRLIE